MKRQLLMMAIGFAMAAQAQTKAPLFETSAKDEIAANRYLAGSNYLDYDRQLTDKALTPSPKGYEPYYMSHYGRHGSRWLIWEGEYTLPMNTLKSAREAITSALTVRAISVTSSGRSSMSNIMM